MKKLLLLSAVLFFSLISFSQDSYSIKSVDIATYNTYTENFDWRGDEDTEMTLTVKGTVMFINDHAKSVYIIGRKLLDETTKKGTKQIGWEATDERQRSCSIKISTSPSGIKKVYVMYDNKAFVYTLKQN